MSTGDLINWLEKQPNLQIVNEAGMSRVGVLMRDKNNVARQWFSGEGLASALTTAAISLDTGG